MNPRAHSLAVSRFAFVTAVTVLLALAAAPRLTWAGPSSACAGSGGPDPLRFRPEAFVAGALDAGAAAPALAASRDPANGTEWVALAWLNDAAEVVVAVSGNGGCSFGGAGFGPTVVSGTGITERPTVALRVDDGNARLCVAWRDADRLLLRMSDVLDGSFGGVLDFAGINLGAPVLTLVPPPADPVFGLAWLGDDGGLSALRFATNATRADTAAWSSEVDVTTGFSPGTELALAADPAGQGGFSVLVTGGPLGGAVHAHSPDAGGAFSAFLPIDDGSLTAPARPAMAAAAVEGDATAAWISATWSGQQSAGPNDDVVAADAARYVSGAVDFDFAPWAGSPNPVMAAPAPALAQPAVAVVTGALGHAAFVAWEEAGEIHITRRAAEPMRPNLSVGCGPFQLTGLSPARGGGTGSRPVAAALLSDVILAYVDDRSGASELWLKRSDAVAPAASGLAGTPADCGEVPSVALTWDAPACDVVDQLIEVGLMSGATDFTVDPGFDAAWTVEGLAPATSYFFRLRQTDSAGNETLSGEIEVSTADCSSILLQTTVLSIVDDCPFGGAGGDGAVDPGETVQLMLRVSNVSDTLAPDVRLRGFSRSTTLTVRTGELMLGDIDAMSVVDVAIDVDVSATEACGSSLGVLLRTESDGAAWGELPALQVPVACTPCFSAACGVTADASLSAPLVICRNDSVDLDGSESAATLMNCAGTILYEWWQGNTLLSTSATTSRSPNNSRTYRLVVRCSTDFDCMGEVDVPVTVNQLPGLSFTQDPPPPHCDGDTVTLTASTGDPMATFAWDTGEDTAAIDVMVGMVYRATVTDSNGCQRATSHRVEFGEVPPAAAGPDIMGCGEVQIGEPAFPLLDYRWTPIEGLSSPNVAQPLAMPLAPTLYTLTVIDPTTGCSATDDVMVEVSEPPPALSQLRVDKNGASLDFTWLNEPTASGARIYSDTAASRARDANGASPTATLVCEGALSCSTTVPAPLLVFYQAVGLCADGVTEGPNR